jgi:hypothetical protein
MVTIMKRLRKTTTVAVAGLGALALLAAPTLATGTNDAGAGQVQLAHMGQGDGWTGHARPMGHGMHHDTDDHMGQGTGHGMHSGMGHGMGHGTGQGMGHGMGHGMMGYGMKMGPADGAAPCPGSAAAIDKEIDADVVRSWLDRSVEAHGNKRLKVGDVKETDDNTIVAEIVTVDDSLVQRIEVDRQTGRMRHVN